jgi:hypothetical protein
MTEAPLACLKCGVQYGYDRIVPHAPGCENERSSGVLWADCVEPGSYPHQKEAFDQTPLSFPPGAGKTGYKIEVEPMTDEQRATRMSPTIRVTIPVALAPVITQCEDCGCDMVETPMDCLIEAYETTGRIICDDCFRSDQEGI